MSLDDIVNVQINLKSSAPTQAGFGRPLIAGYHTRFPERARLYKNADDMLVDGFTVNDHLYKLAQAVKSQRPSPKDFKIGRCALPPTQIIHLTPTVTTQGFVYSGKILGPGGEQSFTYTVGAAATAKIIVEALAPIIEALADVTCTEDDTKLIVTSSAAGKILQFVELVPELNVFDATVNPGIETDLAAIYAYDSDWFGLLLASNSEAEINAASTWIETKRRILCFTTADFGAKDPGTTTDVLSDRKGVDAFNATGWYHHKVGSLLAAAIMAQRLTKVPGSDTWAHKEIAGEEATSVHANGTQYLTAAQEAAVQTKNGNVYTPLGGKGNTFPGKVSGGDYVDAVRYIHFLFARIQEAVIGVLQGSEKIEYTDDGVAAIRSVIMALLIGHTKAPYNALAKDPAPTCTFPRVADIGTADKANRILPDGEFTARYSGAIHAVNLTGNISI